MKLVVLDGHAVNPGDLNWDFLNVFGEVTVYEETEQAQVIPRIRDADIILINKIVIDEALLEACPKLKLVCVLATGYNVVDCDACARRNIPVCNVPAYGTDAVAQFTFSLLLELCNRVGHHDRLVHEGRWEACTSFCFWDTAQMELAGKTMGIFGFGTIGRAVGRIAKAFGMRVLACNRSRCPEGEEIGEYVDLDTLLAESDIVSLHCPLTPETTGLISRNTLAKMKDGAILLNTARGAVVCEEDVRQSLESGKLRGFAADVVSREPIVSANPLLSAPNCILTPHMAWAPIESRKRIMVSAQKSIEGFLSGNLVNTVNM